MGEASKAVRELYDALGRGDPEGASLLCTDDFVLEDVALGRSEGRADAIERWRTLLSAFPGLAFRIDRAHEIGDVCVVEQTLEGRHLGAFIGIPPTGATVRFRAAAVAECRGGRVARLRLYRDYAGFMAQFAFVVRTAVIAAILNRALPISLIVGTTFTLVNQLPKILRGTFLWTDAVRLGVNYAVPFIVATTSALLLKPLKPGTVPGGLFGRLFRRRIARALERAAFERGDGG